MILNEFRVSSIIHAAFKKSLFSTLNTTKAAKMCRNTNLVYQKFMWVNQAEYQVIIGKHEQDSEACNLCSDKPLFLVKLNTDLGNNSIYLKF